MIQKLATVGIRLVSCLLATASLSSPLLAQTWAVGTEREVDSGYYMKLTYSSVGWRVWSTETRNGLSCRAVKSAIGRPHPVPIGVGDGLYRGTPYISISANYEGRIKFYLHGRWGGGGKWRDQGQRFWNEEFHFGELFLRDGRKIEVDIDTWEYPTIYVGLSQERGIIDLNGFDEAMLALKACDPSIDIPEKRDASAPKLKSYRIGFGFHRRVRSIIPAGNIRYRATVDVEGRASDCTILVSSGSEEVDSYLCQVIQEECEFFPALNDNFSPRIGVFEGDFKWTLEAK